jgi:hypothetical protein
MLCEMTNNMGQINQGPCMCDTTQHNEQGGSILTILSHSLEVSKSRLSQDSNSPEILCDFSQSPLGKFWASTLN